jgi:hypothetical protein
MNVELSAKLPKEVKEFLCRAFGDRAEAILQSHNLEAVLVRLGVLEVMHLEELKAEYLINQGIPMLPANSIVAAILKHLQTGKINCI